MREVRWWNFRVISSSIQIWKSQYKEWWEHFEEHHVYVKDLANGDINLGFPYNWNVFVKSVKNLPLYSLWMLR